VFFWELKNKISNDKLCNKVFKTLFSCNFESSRWIFLKMENAYPLVCNMWKVHTRPTSASDFFRSITLTECPQILRLQVSSIFAFEISHKRSSLMITIEAICLCPKRTPSEVKPEALCVLFGAILSRFYFTLLQAL
jgi:hypothetical protein